MEDIKEPITIAIISRKIPIGEYDFLLVPAFAVKGKYNKANKCFIADDGRQFIAGRSRKGVNSQEEFVCDYFANIDSNSSFKAFSGNNIEEKIVSYFEASRGNIAHITVNSEGNVKKEEMLSLYDDENDSEITSEEETKDLDGSRKKKSVRGELESIRKTINALNERFQNNVNDGKYTIEDILRIIDSSTDAVDAIEGLKDSAILHRDAYQMGIEGPLLKGETEEERSARRNQYSAAAENTTAEIINNIPDYFDPKKAYEDVTKTVVGQDQAARELVREIHRKVSDPSQRKFGILLTGHTGSGKTLLIQTLEKVLSIPVIIVNTPQITKAGYVGDDIEEVLFKAYEKYGSDVENGIIYFEEADKKGSDNHSDVSGKGVLDLLLSFLDGTVYQACKNMSHPSNVVPINTGRMIKIAGGAFADIDRFKGNPIGFDHKKDESAGSITVKVFVEISKMTAEFMGRFPTHIRLKKLNVEDIENILRCSDDSILKKQENLFGLYGVKLITTDGYIHRVAEEAVKIDTGGRGLAGKVLETTGPAYDDITWNSGEIESITLTGETVKNPKNYQKVYKRQQ